MDDPTLTRVRGVARKDEPSSSISSQSIDRTVYEGEVDNEHKRALLSGARFLLFSIQWEEPFGLVMTEALACGTPVVADAMGAASEVVKDREVGVLVAAGEWEEMVAAIKSGRLDAIDPHRCRQYVEEHFSIEAMIDGYEAAFEKILADSAQEQVVSGERSVR